MNNYSSKGETVTITAGANITAGEIVRSNALVGVAINDALSGAAAELAIEGVFLLPKATGVINVGDKVDFDDSAGNVGKGIVPAAGDVEDFGVAMETVASGATHLRVKLLPGVGALT
jgi:predicted RecA/RadA family phage recombinase